MLKRADPLETMVMRDIEAVKAEESYKQGEIISVLTNRYERKPKLRAAAIKIHGTSC